MDSAQEFRKIPERGGIWTCCWEEHFISRKVVTKVKEAGNSFWGEGHREGKCLSRTRKVLGKVVNVLISAIGKFCREGLDLILQGLESCLKFSSKWGSIRFRKKTKIHPEISEMMATGSRGTWDWSPLPGWEMVEAGWVFWSPTALDT